MSNPVRHHRAGSLAENAKVVALADHLASHSYNEKKERKLFEADNPNRYHTRSTIGYYMYSATENEWQGWMACAKARAKVAGCE